MPTSTRSVRRLPARVYWFRRALLLGTVFALVFAVAHVLGGSGAAPGVRAKETAGTTKPTTQVTPRVVGPVAPATPAAGAAAVSNVAPDGPCAVNDVTVAPVAGSDPAGRAIPLVLQLSGIRPACTFVVSAKTVVAKVSSSNGKVWSSQDCPSAIPTTTVVVRSAAPTTVQLTWSGRGSDASCSRATDWALPGTYQVTAAAIGSEPSAADLKLTSPPRPIVVKTIAPKQPKTPKAITVRPGAKKPKGTAGTANTGRRRSTG